MPRVEFVGQTSRDVDFPTGATSRLINGYREPLVPGGRAVHVLRAVPGMQDFANITGVFARALMAYGGNLYAVVGSRLWMIAPTGEITDLGNVAAADERTDLTQSAGSVVICAGQQYWTWNGTLLTTHTTGAVTQVGSVTYLGGYVLVSQIDGRVFAWSDLAAPATFDGLSFASAEITDEPILRLVTFRDALYIFKRGGFEVWAVSGLAGDEAFTRIAGAQGEPGLLAYSLVTTFPNGMAWVGSDGRVHVAGVGPVSTPPVEVAIERSGPERLFFYEQRGHGFLCLTFREQPAWCYDVATGEWHERAQDDGPWSARASAKLGADWYVATDGGKVARLQSACLDLGRPMVRRFVSNTLEVGRRFTVPKIEAFTRPANDEQGDGTPAKVTLRTSRDGGMTWSAAKDRPVGLPGNYQQRLVWRALGQFRAATVELSVTGATDLPLLSSLDVEVD